MSLKPYPVYKDSGVNWLGRVPDDWEVRPSKSVFGLRNSPEVAGDIHLTPSQSLGVLPQSEYMRVTGNKVVLALAGTTMKHVEVDDFVIHLRSFQGGIEWSGYRGRVSPAYTVLMPKSGVIPAFFKYCLKSRGYIETIASLTDQLRDGQSMRYYDFGKTPLPLPPQSDQRAIVAYLDRETAEIDAFIADQEELIVLLNERRAATITQAVTKGLDPTVPMNDSGVDWLGDIPANWRVNKVGRCVSINGGQVDPRVSPYDEMYLVAPNHIESATGKLLYLETSLEQGADSGKYYVRAGQVIYSKIRPNLMKTIIAPVDCLCSADMYGLEADSTQLSNEFLRYVLLSRPFRDYAVDQSIRVAMPKLNHETVKAAPIWLPTLPEQEAIVTFLDEELPEIDATIADAQESIALSKERRAALISAAVTGKIDVRDAIASNQQLLEGEFVVH